MLLTKSLQQEKNIYIDIIRPLNGQDCDLPNVAFEYDNQKW